MNNISKFSALALLAFYGLFSSASMAATLNFDSLAVGSNINGTNLGGVTFTAPDGVVNVYNGSDVLSISQANTIVASGWDVGKTILVTFDSYINYFSIFGGDSGGDTDRFSITAFDSNNNQLAFADTGNFNGPDPLNIAAGATMGDYRFLSLSASNIKSVLLTQVNWGVGFDNLTYTTVPVPSAFWLFGSSIFALLNIKRKTRV